MQIVQRPRTTTVHNHDLSELCTPVAQVAERQHLRRFGQPPSTRRATDTVGHVRPSCVRRGWSDRLERTRQRSVRSRSQHRQLRSPTEDAFVSTVFGVLSALETLCDNDIDIDTPNHETSILIS